MGGISRTNKWDSAAGARLDFAQDFVNKSFTERQKVRVLIGPFAIGQMQMIGRPELLLTSLRPPSDHAVSWYNNACVCNIERRTELENCLKTHTFEEYAARISGQVVATLLGWGPPPQKARRFAAAEECARNARGNISLQLEELFFKLLRTQLSQPCISVLPTYYL